jgi:hypothetical protein
LTQKAPYLGLFVVLARVFFPFSCFCPNIAYNARLSCCQSAVAVIAVLNNIGMVLMLMLSIGVEQGLVRFL